MQVNEYQDATQEEKRNPSGDDVVTGSSDKAAKLFSGLEMGSMHRVGIDPFLSL
jgi:hypothetical protein